MRSIDVIAMAFGNLWRRKTRTILTLLGVIIGTTSIVVMISIGLNMERQVQKSMEMAGGMTTIEVRGGFSQMYEMSEANGGGGKRSKEKPPQLTDEIVNQIASIDNVSAVMKRLRTDLLLVSGKYRAYTQLIGVEPSAMVAFDIKVGEGRLLQDGDINGAFFGNEIAYQFMDPKDRNQNGGFRYFGPGAPERPEPNVDIFKDRIIMTLDHSYGQNYENKPKYKRYNITVVGTPPKDDYSNSYEIYMPMEFVKKIIAERQKIENNNGERVRRPKETVYEEIKVKVDNVKNVNKVQDKIKEMGFEAWSNAQWMEQSKKTTNIIQIVLGGIGAISLLVAAIGITNTMIMSIYERTREIGIMKVIGCLVGNIRKMFLIEAGLIGLLGGMVGILISFGISYLLNKFLAPMMMGGYGGSQEASASYIPIWLVFGSVVFSSFIGILAGFYPAARATKLSALAAIKND